MSISLPANFENDIQGRNIVLTPIVYIGNYGSSTAMAISTGANPIGDITPLPLLLNIPSLKESIDLENRNYKISSINIDLSNYEYDGKRLSELVSERWGSIINVECRIFWASESTSLLTRRDKDIESVWTDGDALQIYIGTIRKYDHDEEKVRLVVEDRSQATLHADLPRDKIEDGPEVPDKYKLKPIPMVYGHVDISPCVIRSSPNQANVDFAQGDTEIIADIDDSNVQITKPRVYDNNTVFDIETAVTSRADNVYPSTFLGYGVDNPICSFSDNKIILTHMGGDDPSTRNPVADDAIIGYKIISPNAMQIHPIQEKSYLYSETLDDGEMGGQAYYTGVYVQGSYLASIKGTMAKDSGVDAAFGWWCAGQSRLDSIAGEDDFGDIMPGLSEDNFADTPNQNKYLLGTRIITNAPSGYEFTQSVIQYDVVLYHGGYLHEFDENILFRIGESTEGDDVNKFELSMPWSDYGPNQQGNQWVPLGQNHLPSAPKYIDVGSGGHSLLVYMVPSHGSVLMGAGRIDFKQLDLHFCALIEGVGNLDYYADVVGRVGLHEIPSQIINTVPTIIASIMERELGVGDVDWVTSSIPDYSSWEYAFTVAEKINSKKLLEGLSAASPYIPHFDNMGRFKLDAIKSVYYRTATAAGLESQTGSYTPYVEIKADDVISHSFSRTKIDDVYTWIELEYNWDYARNKFNSTAMSGVPSQFNWEGPYGDPLQEAQKYNPDYYGLPADHSESKLIIDDDRGKYIRDPATAQKFVEFMALFYANQHLKIKARLPLKYMDIEVGDIVRFDRVVGVKPYGINYAKDASFYEAIDPATKFYGDRVNGQQVFPDLMVFSTKKTMEFCEIECIQMHNTKSNLRYIVDEKYGCTNPDAWNYDDEALSDDGSCLVPHYDVSGNAVSGDHDLFDYEFIVTEICPYYFMPGSQDVYASNYPEDEIAAYDIGVNLAVPSNGTFMIDDPSHYSSAQAWYLNWRAGAAGYEVRPRFYGSAYCSWENVIGNRPKQLRISTNYHGQDNINQHFVPFDTEAGIEHTNVSTWGGVNYPWQYIQFTNPEAQYERMVVNGSLKLNLYRFDFENIDGDHQPIIVDIILDTPGWISVTTGLEEYATNTALNFNVPPNPLQPEIFSSQDNIAQHIRADYIDGSDVYYLDDFYNGKHSIPTMFLPNTLIGFSLLDIGSPADNFSVFYNTIWTIPFKIRCRNFWNWYNTQGGTYDNLSTGQFTEWEFPMVLRFGCTPEPINLDPASWGG